SHVDGERTRVMVANRSSSRMAVRNRNVLMTYSIGGTPVFENIMRERFFTLKLLRHDRIAHQVSHVERLPVIDALFDLTCPIMILNIQLGTTGSYARGIMCSQ